MSSSVLDLDIVEELRMRRWARENYVPVEQRKPSWHPIVHEEMEKKDRESGSSPVAPAYAWSDS